MFSTTFFSSHYSPRICFFIALIATLIFRFWLGFAAPMTGDEAYFIQWGLNPDWGFYDHPPMVGWILWLLLQVSSAEIWLRLPIILLPALISLSMVWFFKNTFPEKIYWAALLFLLAPVNIWAVFITTDTPLIYSTFFCVVCFAAARQHQSLNLYALAGVFLGFAFLSKYFSFLAFIVLLGFFIFSAKSRDAVKGFILMMVVTLPFIAINIYWNYQHCWANIMFNIFNRHGGAGLSLKTPITYLLMLIYLASPPVLYYFYRHRSRWREVWAKENSRLYLLFATLPFAIFALLSLVKLIGLHWVLSFYPFLFIAALFLFDKEDLVKCVKFMFWFGLLHAIIIIATSLRPIEAWKNTQLYSGSVKTAKMPYDGIVLTFKAKEIIQQLKPYEGQYEFATEGYSPSTTLAYNAGKYFFVFGEASSHARHDDILTDFRKLAGKNILVLRKTAPELSQYQPYFKSVEFKQINVKGVTFHIVLGKNFDYATYREKILKTVRDKYYAIPSYLPMGRCYFCERYFPEKEMN